jgi:Domain of unknown function (DUF4838)
LTPDKNTLLIAGDRPRGSLYAVYELLEREFNVRFLSATHEIVPKRAKPTIANLNYRYAPQFVYREIHSTTVKKNNVLVTKFRLNGSMFRAKIPASLGGFYQMSMRHSLLNKYVTRVNPKKRKRKNAAKVKDWFKIKPEWFSFRKKQNARIPKQLCLSNPDVIAQIVKDVLVEQKKMPERRFIGLGAADNNKVCQCEKCLKLYKRYATTGAGVWLAANAIAKAVRKKYPKAEVVNMAYWSTERPPEGLKLEPNISVVLAMIDRNHGLAPSATPRHDVYLKRYNELTNNKVYIWDYYARFRNFIIPTPNLDVMESAVRTYKKNHIHGVFAQLPWGTLGEFIEFRTYLLAKLLWNPQLDGKKLMRQYFKDQYGKAADVLIAYVDLLNKARDRQKGIWIGCFAEKTSHWLTTEDIFKANALFSKALALTAADAKVNRRVRRLEASILLVNIFRYKEIAKLAKEKGSPLKSRKELIDQLEALGKEFKCHVYKEWDSFKNLIKKLRKKDSSKIIDVDPKAVSYVVPLKKMKGMDIKIVDGIAVIPSKQIERAFSWIKLEYGIVYEIPPEQAGTWQVSVTLRSTPASGNSPATAYLGIYAPKEICRQALKVSKGDSSWQTINLGKFYLQAGSKIWIVPGVINFAPSIEVKSIVLSR